MQIAIFSHKEYFHEFNCILDGQDKDLVTEQKKKVCILVEQLGKGGAERAAGILSGMLHDRGFTVYVASITSLIEYPYSGKLIDLGVYKNDKNDIFDKFKRFRKFAHFLKTAQIDIVIDYRMRQSIVKEFLISKSLYKTVEVIYTVHSYKISYYFPLQRKLTNLLYKKALSINTITSGIKERIVNEYKLNNISVIPNAVNLKQIEELANAECDIDKPFILAAGRMDDDIKQFDKLIETYATSKLPQNGIYLVILGKGALLNSLKTLAAKLNIGKMVIFKGFLPNPFPYYKKAMFFVQCSKFEGFPMVMLESLACGTPVIALDCKTGPAEIINHNSNGLLLPYNDFAALEKIMNELVTEPELLAKLRENAKSSIAKYSTEAIALQWENLFKTAKK